jgi:hypothetical protein
MRRPPFERPRNVDAGRRMRRPYGNRLTHVTP